MDAGLGSLAEQARKFYKVPGSRRKKVALIILISELMVGEGCTQGPRDYLFSTERLAKDHRPCPRTGAGEIRSRDFTD